MNIIKDDLIIRRDEILTFTHSVSETFLALYEIALQDKELLEGRPMALIVEQLFTIESKPGGPYYSTFTNGSIQPKIFDSETNTAIARFLGLYDIELPALTEFLEGKTFLVPEDSVKKSTLSRQEKELFVAMRTNIKNRLKAFPRDMQKRALAVIQRTIAGNPDKQMSLMAYYMTLALGNGMNTQTKKYVTEMGVANSFFWTAFIIYDDFWDEDEAQDTRLLPIANFFARSYSEYFTSLLPERVGFKTFFHKVMDALDSANVW
ncbi:hypothetical protein K2Q02_01470, partial [Patescibacteria group bacterium]|nr:hypothetical protein [Patescibacteria group bacterium]